MPSHRPTPNIAPSWNVAPTDPLPVVHYDRRAGERSLDVMRWGLVPYWAKDIKVGFANINAKAEGIEGKPAFREAFQRWRCLVPVDNFYEWVRRGHRQLEGPGSEDSRDCTVVISLCRNGNAADFRPDSECLRTGSSVLGGTEVIATEIEQVVDLVVG
jgi:SOS response associated peptidase (SRAP)